MTIKELKEKLDKFNDDSLIVYVQMTNNYPDNDDSPAESVSKHGSVAVIIKD
jgi:uncharacterized protein YkvS